MKMLLAATALAPFVLPVAPASAGACVHDHPFNGDHGGAPHFHQQCHPQRYHEGGCSFAAVTDAVAGEGQMSGEIDVEAIVYSTDNPADNPMSATFTCYIKVNGATQPGAVVTASGTVVVAGGGVVTYTSNDVSDFVQLCQDVSYSNGFNTSECFEADTFEIPPPIVWEVVDPAACPILASAAGTYDVGGHIVFVNGQGDVWIDGDGFYDCMPYGNVFGFPPNG